MNESPTADHSRSAGPANVQLRDLSVQAGQQLLLADTSVRFEAGKVSLIVGRSGVGKSTLLKAIAGLIDEREEGLRVTGQIALCDGQGKQSRDRRSVGVVFQDYALFDELSPLKNVQLARAHRPRSSGADDALAPQPLLDELGVPTDVPTASLSGGQRQRLAIARVLAYNPNVVLYDEPTSGLDPISSSLINRLVNDLKERLGICQVVVTHDMHSAYSIGDRLALLHNGSIRAIGTPNEIQSSGDPAIQQFIHGKIDGPLSRDDRHLHDGEFPAQDAPGAAAEALAAGPEDTPAETEKRSES